MSVRRISPSIVGGVATGDFTLVRFKRAKPLASGKHSLRALILGATASAILWVGILSATTNLL